MGEAGTTSAPSDWLKVDLNLLIPLNALLMERNVTRAAERVSMGQPAMSAILAKLRRHFNDPLLVRQGRAMLLTPFAESLLQPVQSALMAAREVLTSGRQPFDPATAQRTFAMIACDYTAGTLLLPALRGLTDDAPGVRVTVEFPGAEPVEQLRTGRCDLLVWPLQPQLPELPELANFPHAVLFTDEVVAVADRDDDTVTGPLTAEALANVPTVQVAGMAGGMLTGQGPRQPATVTVGSYALALQAVSGSALVTLTPRRLFERFATVLHLREIPLAGEPRTLTMAMFWHPRSMLAPAHQWIRARLGDAATRV